MTQKAMEKSGVETISYGNQCDRLKKSEVRENEVQKVYDAAVICGGF